MESLKVYVGCAGWAIPREHAALFPAAGSHLQRYAARFPAVEINSSFYRSHRPATYARWAAATPKDFCFAVKLPREITHTRRLVDVEATLEAFLDEVRALGAKLGPLLVQLPPSLPFDSTVAGAFFAALRRRYTGGVVCEPRHPSWFAAEPDRMLRELEIARVAADPALLPAAALPGGSDRLVYYRLHGSPRVYYSVYGDRYLEDLVRSLAGAARAAQVCCIFDNTASGAAIPNALGVLERLESAGP